MFRELLFGHFGAAERVLGAAFLALQGGTACFGSCFCATLGRHSVFRELLFWHFRAAELVLGAKGCLQKGQGPDLAPNPVKRAFFKRKKTIFGGP